MSVDSALSKKKKKKEQAQNIRVQHKLNMVFECIGYMHLHDVM